MANLIKRNDDLFSIFDDFFKRDWTELNQGLNAVSLGTKMPAVNITETETSFDLEVAAPGLKKEDFKVSVENGTLTLSTEKETTTEESKDFYTRKEFNFTSFKRSFRLPEKTVDFDKIEGKYEDGILHIIVPKKEEVITKAVREIQIN